MSSGKKTVCANAVMDSRCQEFNIQFYFPVFFYDLDLYYVCDGVCVRGKEIAAKEYMGQRE